MPINRIPKLRGTGLPGPFDPTMLTSIVDGQVPAWNATNERWEAGDVDAFPADPGADSLLMWDDSASAAIWTDEIADSFLSANVPLLDATSNTFTGDISSGGQVLIANGSPGAPAIALTSDPDTGISGIPTRIDIVTAGVSRHVFRSIDFLCATPIYITEQAAASVDFAGRGQIWVKNTTPCELWFTDDAGTDHQVALV